jgi:hypothetical protein
MTRMFWSDLAAILIQRLAETNSVRLQMRVYFPGFRICLSLMTCHPSPITGNIPP